MHALTLMLTSLVDVLYPEDCLICDRAVSPTVPGPRVAGLRPWDRRHCCPACLEDLLAEGPVHRRRDGLEVWAGAPTGRRLVALVSGWKYQGLRGAAWAAAQLAKPALDLAVAQVGPGVVLTPLAMHRARRRRRGFDQADQLARLLGERGGPAVATALLRRCRNTDQQAKISAEGDGRAANVRGAFEAVRAPSGAPPLLLVDDLVTSGATASAAATTLSAQGWSVAGIVALGLSLPSA